MHFQKAGTLTIENYYSCEEIDTLTQYNDILYVNFLAIPLFLKYINNSFFLCLGPRLILHQIFQFAYRGSVVFNLEQFLYLFRHPLIFFTTMACLLQKMSLTQIRLMFSVLRFQFFVVSGRPCSDGCSLDTLTGAHTLLILDS